MRLGSSAGWETTKVRFGFSARLHCKRLRKCVLDLALAERLRECTSWIYCSHVLSNKSLRKCVLDLALAKRLRKCVLDLVRVGNLEWDANRRRLGVAAKVIYKLDIDPNSKQLHSCRKTRFRFSTSWQTIKMRFEFSAI